MSDTISALDLVDGARLIGKDRHEIDRIDRQIDYFGDGAANPGPRGAEARRRVAGDALVGRRP